MKTLDVEPYFKRTELTESPVGRIVYRRHAGELSLIIAYAAEALSRWAGAASKGVTPESYYAPPRDFRCLCFIGVDDVQYCGRPWNGSDHDWARHRITRQPMPAYISDWTVKPEGSCFRMEILLSPKHGSRFSWRFRGLCEYQRWGRRLAGPVKTDPAEMRFVDTVTGEVFTFRDAFDVE